MDKLEIAKKLLQRIGMPVRQQSDLCALTLLAMCGLSKREPWKNAVNEWMRIHDIMQFIATHYGIKYAENSRETFRKQALHPFRTAALVEDNGLATNSPNYRYRITSEFIEVVKNTIYRRNDIMDYPTLVDFISSHDALSDIYASKKRMNKMPVRINSNDFSFSPGKHNLLQKAIIEEFAPRFAPDAECLYVGDTIQKELVNNISKLRELGFEVTPHDKMPDVILYSNSKDWLYFIEAVTSVGPMDAKRVVEIDALTCNVSSGKIYVTAFLDFITFKKFSEQLAWETEVWIADMPDHMIHLNGDKFLGPR